MKKIIAIVVGMLFAGLILALWRADYRMKHRKYIRIPIKKLDA